VAAPDEPLVVRPGLVVPEAELDERFTTSGGPGGQHANRSRTRVELRLDLVTSTAFSEHQRTRLRDLFGDELRVVVDEERSQSRNREIARARLAARLRAGLTPQRTRTATRPTKGSRQRRLEAKRRRSEVKRERRRPGRDD
jgi:ribosome-associated protein